MAKVVDPKLLGKPEQKKWVSYVKQRIRKNKNFLAICSGPTGSGKSFSMLSYADLLRQELLGKPFEIKNCCFTSREIMSRINSGELQRGDVLIWDEAGVDLSNRTWYSLSNKVINYLLQTFRHRQIILLFTAPYSDFLDSATHKLFHAEFRTAGINYKKKLSILKPQLLQYNARLKKYYYHRLRVITKEGNVPVDLMELQAPRKELIVEYEKKKTTFTRELNKTIEEDLRKKEKKKRPKFQCEKCKYKWLGRGNNKDKQCPKCRTNYVIQL